MISDRERILDRVADLMDPVPDALPSVRRRIARRHRNRRIGGVTVGVGVIAAFIAIGLRVVGEQATPLDRQPVELASSTDGLTWSFFATRSEAGGTITVGGPTRSMAISLQVPWGLTRDGVVFVDRAIDGSRFIVGVAGSEVATLTEVASGNHVDLPLYPIPFDEAGSAQAFIVPITGDSKGWLVARDDGGQMVQTTGFEPGASCEVPTRCPAEPADTVLVDTTDDGTRIRVVVMGDRLALIDDLGADRGRVSGPTDDLVDLAVTDVTRLGMPVVLGVASEGLTRISLVGRFDGAGSDEIVDVPATILHDGRVAFLAYRYASYFTPHTLLIRDPVCSRSLALRYPSLARVAVPEVGGCR